MVIYRNTEGLEVNFKQRANFSSSHNTRLTSVCMYATHFLHVSR